MSLDVGIYCFGLISGLIVARRLAPRYLVWKIKQNARKMRK